MLLKHFFRFTLLGLLSFTLNSAQTPDSIITGAEQLNVYLPLINKKNVAVVANQTSIVGNNHLIDVLLHSKIAVKKILTPEHGFRGKAEAGEDVASYTDKQTGLPVVSLYGDHKKPTAEDFSGIDLVIFDLQDVGVRFYTYSSTLQYVMEACAEQKKKLILLDRPNPNGYYVDGPVLESAYKSFVGMNPIPVVYGLTLGEYAKMLNGEGWLNNKLQCDLEVIPVKGYTHSTQYQLPVRPSPNLPNMTAVYLYPSLCFFEGTIVSIGRGTDYPFQVVGYPGFTEGPLEFTPHKNPEMKLAQLYENQKCNGYDLRDFGNYYIPTSKKLYLFWLKNIYDNYPKKDKFFNSYFDKLAGTDKLRKQIIEGLNEDQIRLTWQKDLDAYKVIRKKYLLYPDFE
ncbi:MAG: DUF1343 domain-containing protein [Bacteroidetes bacterium]|nr:DUF1343 domain-containing protein [Bacteroidota bacterium]